MSDMQITKDATSQFVELVIIDNTTGLAELGVLWNEAGIDLNYRRDGAVVVSITEKALSTPALTDAYDSGGFLEVANGRYRLDVPDAAFATGVDKVTIGGTITGMIVIPVTVQLLDLDLMAANRGTDSAATSTKQDTMETTLGAIPTTAMRGTDNVVLAGPTKAELDVLGTAALATSGKQDTMETTLGAIPTTAMRGTENAATETKQDIIDTAVDAIKAVTDLFIAAKGEPTGVPAVNETPLVKLDYLFMALRNKLTVTATKKQYFDDGGAAEWEKDVSDDGSTYTETEANII